MKHAPLLGNVLLYNGDELKGCAVLGVCDDGAPVAVDLNSPTAGSVLLLKAPATAKTELLVSIVQSAARLNEQVELHVLTTLSDYEARLRGENGFMRAENYTESSVVHDLYIRMQERMTGKEKAAPIILVADDLRMVQKKDIHKFLALAKDGPAQNIRVITCYDSNVLEFKTVMEHCSREWFRMVLGGETRWVSGVVGE